MEPVMVDLCGSSDEEDAAAAKRPKRVSSRLAAKELQPDSKVLLHYPTKGAKGSIMLTYGDVRRLRRHGAAVAPEQLLLNDSLVDFYVKYLMEHSNQFADAGIGGLTAPARERVHVFNAFFLKRLRLSIQKGTLDGMVKWAQNVDLFAKDLIFVPVHEMRHHGHWALAVICFPDLVVAPPDERCKGDDELSTAAAAAADVSAHQVAETKAETKADEAAAGRSSSGPLDVPLDASPLDGSPLDVPLDGSPLDVPLDASPLDVPLDASPLDVPLDASTAAAVEHADGGERLRSSTAGNLQALTGRDGAPAVPVPAPVPVMIPAAPATLAALPVPAGALPLAAEAAVGASTAGAHVETLPQETDESAAAVPDVRGTASSSGGSSGGGGGSSGGGDSQAGRRLGRPCILFLDSFVQHSQKALFLQLRTFLEYYWESQYRNKQIKGYPNSGRGKDTELPKPTPTTAATGPPVRAKAGRPSAGSAPNTAAGAGKGSGNRDVNGEPSSASLPSGQLSSGRASSGQVSSGQLQASGRPRRSSRSAAADGAAANGVVAGGVAADSAGTGGAAVDCAADGADAAAADLADENTDSAGAGEGKRTRAGRLSRRAAAVGQGRMLDCLQAEDAYQAQDEGALRSGPAACAPRDPSVPSLPAQQPVPSLPAQQPRALPTCPAAP